MGMFDYVEYSWKCPLCGNVQDECQSKSAIDGLRVLRKLKPNYVDNFYDFCKECHKKNISVGMDITIRRME